jgi:cytochrome c oxidase assembly factor CtaG
MSPVVDAFFHSWPCDPGLLVAFCLTAVVYLRGWFVLRRRDAERWHAGRLAVFLGGLAAIYLALASPVEPFSFLFLQVHMVQHLLLMMVAPPLVWLGDPLLPMLHGLPAAIRRYWVAPWFRSPAVRRLFQWLSHPVTAWLLYVGATWLWHVPSLYEVAVRSNGWHYLQHLTFLGTALVFWYPVVQPYPSRPRWSRWLLFPYLLLADVQNTVLAALLTFSDRLLYPYYAQVPRLSGLSALEDQAAAGVVMWVPGSLAFLVPLFWLGTRSLFGHGWQKGRQRAAARIVDPAVTGRMSLPVISASSLVGPKKSAAWDLLRVPGLGRFLRWRHARVRLQMPLLLLAGVLIYDGLTGPAVAPMNLAGVLPWIHWRGVVILGLLIVGNVFCMACPFMLPRMLARRLFPQHYAWPRWLRNKWLAVALLAVFLWAYEAFALWDSPWWTAWIALGYFAGALVIDGFFRGAAFCKYVCPIGQFNFVQSLVSPWEVKVRDSGICTSCRTKDCIRGRPATAGPAPAPAARGCELQLFLPRKSSNLDCTLCLDCVHACPQDNVGIILSAPPTSELWHDRLRSGIGRFGKRPDLAALALLLVFGAFANAAGMVGPVADWQERLRARWGHGDLFWAVTAYYLFALVALPCAAVALAAVLSRWWGRLSSSWPEVATRQVYALVPLGFAMWLSHYSFHLLTSYDAAIPVAQRFAADLGANLGAPDWACACCRPVGDWLPRLEILLLDVGLLLSLYAGYRIALSCTPDLPCALKVLAPWAVVIVLLFATGVWIVLQPMQMRGTMQMPG